MSNESNAMQQAASLHPVVSCGECKHWRKIRDESRRIDDEITWPGPHGECNLHDEFSTDKKAWTYSREADDAALITQPDFGCINGEAANEKLTPLPPTATVDGKEKL